MAAIPTRCGWVFDHSRGPFWLRLGRAALYRGFPIRQRRKRSSAASLSTSRRLEIGDTAGWKPALRFPHVVRAPGFVSFGRRIRVNKDFQWRIGRGHNHPFANLLYSFDHDNLAGMEPLLNDPQRAAPLADAHRLDVDFVLRFHDGDLIAALSFGNRALSDQHRAAHEVAVTPNAAQRPRAPH